MAEYRQSEPGGAFEWSAADAARRQNISEGHAQIREKVGRNLPSAYSRSLGRAGPNWEFGGSGPGTPGGPGGGQGGGGHGSEGDGSRGAPEPGPEPGKLGSRLGQMFGNPDVRRQVLKISNNWELSNQIRRGGIHAAVRHAFGLPLIPSHKEDYLYARQRNLDPNPLTGRNPGHYQPEDWPTEV